MGDCALRINDAQPVLRDHPAEPIFAAWRAALIAVDQARSEATVRAALVGGWAQADAEARKAAGEIAFADPAFARDPLSTGLAGMRAARPGDALAIGVADGVGDMGHDFCWQVRSPETEAQSLALWTDGWLSPGGQTIESWLTAADAASAADPRRIGRHRCVKGPRACGRHDDMGLVLIRRVPA